tara:strand:- start:433 stop:1743 length:1311 start_codon:yes stop_codon:yes gene_type:complete
MKIIKKVEINTNPITSNLQYKNFTVIGDPGAVFSVTVTNEDNSYYNFSEEVDQNGTLKTALGFAATPAKLFQKTLNSNGIYTGAIQFPVVTDNDEYSVIFYADQHFDTFFDSSLTTNSVYALPVIYQYLDTTLTFSLSSAADVASDEYYNTFPSNVTSVGASSQIIGNPSNRTFSITWPVTLSGSNFVIIKQPSVKDFEFTTTKDTRTAGSSSKVLELKNITGLSPGMAVSGTGIAVGATITSIQKGYKDYNNSSDRGDVYKIPVEVKTINGVNTLVQGEGGTVFISGASTFVVDRTITFTGKGSSHSENFNSTVFSISKPVLTIDPVVTTTTAAVAATATVIPVTSTNGIKDDVSVATGVGINSASTMTVTGISSLNLTVRALVAGDNEALENGQTVTFTGSSRSATITADVLVENHGKENLTLTLNLDNILTIE